MMEPWSYGNRLYRAAWYAKDDASRSTLEIGPYRHASGHLYRKFQHSWPLFRRHITLTARMMVLRRTLKPEEMDEPDQLAVVTAERAQLAYFMPGFHPWNHDDRALIGRYEGAYADALMPAHSSAAPAAA